MHSFQLTIWWCNFSAMDQKKISVLWERGSPDSEGDLIMMVHDIFVFMKAWRTDAMSSGRIFRPDFCWLRGTMGTKSFYICIRILFVCLIWSSDCLAVLHTYSNDHGAITIDLQHMKAWTKNGFLFKLRYFKNRS